MNLPNKFLVCSLFSSLLSASFAAEEAALIKIDLDRTVDAIDPKIYGSFLEPLGRFPVVYGSLYDPDSSLSDENGFRKEYLQQVRELQVPIVRWPGGNFVSGYNWEDGIGPKDQRPVKLDRSRTRPESNQMGTDEYVAFCNLVGAENFICINAGSGTIDDASNWVEYCNAPVGTYYADLRAKYGNPEPFDVKYWGLGNEADGPWQIGYKTKEEYVRFASEAAKVMKMVDEDIKLIASGSSNYPLVTSSYDPNDGWIDWNDYILDKMYEDIDYISLHRYATQALRAIDKPVFADTMSLGLDIEEKIVVTKGLIEKAKSKAVSDHDVYISFDEYGARGNTIAGPLLLSQHLNAFIRHADIVKMANLTFLTSLTGITEDGSYKTSLYYPFSLFSNNCRGVSLDVYSRCETYSNELFKEVPYLDVTAVLNEEKGALFINVVNRSEIDAIETDIELQSGEYMGSATVRTVTGDSIDATNTAEVEQVDIDEGSIKFKKNMIRYSFPAHSLTQMEIPVK
ncbi:alpha-L-arabinofuranosidase [Pelagicoccus sp. NFK12]|uniref:non-reducing end alpha-L-arabinofuranosidase n=1 Tax=Pelagicoccus enzymogenes TaxID=2773457 RepID=A0A927IDU5_9BACT|nr:alpha-L-arabinofuranosidase C-terminal domain-containing protein [Pelagicoccus enzymogenes]MBD5778347.1 alpha-L-arabinofuranosidase [Pelagicoccus enzymogenes]